MGIAEAQHDPGAPLASAEAATEPPSNDARSNPPMTPSYRRPRKERSRAARRERDLAAASGSDCSLSPMTRDQPACVRWRRHFSRPRNDGLVVRTRVLPMPMSGSRSHHERISCGSESLTRTSPPACTTSPIRGAAGQLDPWAADTEGRIFHRAICAPASNRATPIRWRTSNRHNRNPRRQAPNDREVSMPARGCRLSCAALA